MTPDEWVGLAMAVMVLVGAIAACYAKLCVVASKVESSKAALDRLLGRDDERESRCVRHWARTEELDRRLARLEEGG
jgi:hypothetical protein